MASLTVSKTKGKKATKTKDKKATADLKLKRKQQQQLEISRNNFVCLMNELNTTIFKRYRSIKRKSYTHDSKAYKMLVDLADIVTHLEKQNKDLEKVNQALEAKNAEFEEENVELYDLLENQKNSVEGKSRAFQRVKKLVKQNDDLKEEVKDLKETIKYQQNKINCNVFKYGQLSYARIEEKLAKERKERERLAEILDCDSDEAIEHTLADGKEVLKCPKTNILYDCESFNQIGYWQSKTNTLIDEEEELEVVEITLAEGRKAYHNIENNLLYDFESQELLGYWSPMFNRIEKYQPSDFEMKYHISEDGLLSLR